LATVGTQDTWLDGYGIIAYGLVPLAFIPMAAGMIASPRANRFVECVFTAPVNRRDWLAAKFLVLVTLAVAYYVALLPMMLVYVAHVGLPPLLHKFLLWTPGLLIASIAIGTLIGVLFIGRSLAAPIGAGMGVLLAYVGLMPLQELMVSLGNGATRTGHLTLMSPAVLLKNALGFVLGNQPHSRNHHAHLDQPGGCGGRRAGAGSMGLSARAGRRDLGSNPPAALDDCAGNGRAAAGPGLPGRHELRQSPAQGEQCTGDSRAVSSAESTPRWFGREAACRAGAAAP
jgi:hypothetical protein